MFFDHETKENRWFTQGFWDIDCYDYWNDVISSENKKIIKNFSDHEKSMICIFIETAIKFSIKDKINSKIFQTISDYLGYPDGSGVRKDGNEYISQLSKNLPSSLEDRKEKDKLQLEISSDEDIQQYINSQIRMIGNYTISELSKFKIIYLETGILKGPKDIIMDQKWKEEYIQYMNN
jgi:hypothetical protein